MHTYTLMLSLSFTHTLTHSHTHALSLSFTHSLALSFIPTHILMHTSIFFAHCGSLPIVLLLSPPALAILAVPDVPYPHAHKSDEISRMLKMVVKRQVLRMLVPLVTLSVVICLLVYLAVRVCSGVTSEREDDADNTNSSSSSNSSSSGGKSKRD
jgi:hypothetical protein